MSPLASRRADMPQFCGGVSVFFQGKSVSIRIIPTYPTQNVETNARNTVLLFITGTHK